MHSCTVHQSRCRVIKSSLEVFSTHHHLRSIFAVRECVTLCALLPCSACNNGVDGSRVHHVLTSPRHGMMQFYLRRLAIRFHRAARSESTGALDVAPGGFASIERTAGWSLTLATGFRQTRSGQSVITKSSDTGVVQITARLAATEAARRRVMLAYWQRAIERLAQHSKHGRLGCERRVNWLLRSSCQKWFLVRWLASFSQGTGPCVRRRFSHHTSSRLSNTRIPSEVVKASTALRLVFISARRRRHAAAAITNRPLWAGGSDE